MIGIEKSPLAPEVFPVLDSIDGVRLATTCTGTKYRNRDDLLLVECAAGTQVAGVFTQSTTASAPVYWCKKNIQNHCGRALVVNAGNANAFTGRIGAQHVQIMASSVADQLDCDVDDIFIASTGVIGEFLPIDKFTESVDSVAVELGDDKWQNAADAILTTDTFSKGASIRTNIGDTPVTINGIAKGSGMIEPNMATMLAFIFTDANIRGDVLQELLVQANEPSFNAITVDSDTSTSDTCLLFATGKAENDLPVTVSDPILDAFRQSLSELMLDLAIQVIRDGEGASKLIEIDVDGAINDNSAKVIAKSIANSPLVKTAIAGEDANWGRVVMAIGKTGEPCDQNLLGIAFGGMTIAENGEQVESYDESKVNEHLSNQHIVINVTMGQGSGHAKVWTCDLTHGYISINADYRS